MTCTCRHLCLTKSVLSKFTLDMATHTFADVDLTDLLSLSLSCMLLPQGSSTCTALAKTQDSRLSLLHRLQLVLEKRGGGLQLFQAFGCLRLVTCCRAGCQQFLH